MSAGDSTGWGVVNRGWYQQPHHNVLICISCIQFLKQSKKKEFEKNHAPHPQLTSTNINKTHSHTGRASKICSKEMQREKTQIFEKKNENQTHTHVHTERHSYNMSNFLMCFFICIGVLCGYTSLVGPKDNM